VTACLLHGQDASQTGVHGVIYDAANGQPVRKATVTVQQQRDLSATTDLDGRYQLAIPPGTHVLVVSAANFLETTIDGVTVKAGELTEASTVMAAVGSVTTLDVVEKVGAIAATSAAMLAERKLSAVVSDAISGEEIKKSVASDAAEALEKVTGVSIVDNGYVYVRGLGERYSATMLNNSLLPTTEPERRVVPLDLFPASLIENIKVLKTYSPDMPGEFAGGLVNMTTIDFPTSPTLRAGMSYGFNTLTSFNRFANYSGGSRDFFGFDDGTRNIPSAIPANGRLFPGSYTQQEFQQFGRSFPVNWEPSFIDSMRPSQSYNVVAGNSFGRFGLVGAVTFSNKPQRYSELQRYMVNAGGPTPKIFTEYPDFQSSMQTARIGALFNAAVKLTSNHKLVWRNTVTRDSDKEARVFTGYNGGLDNTIEATRLRWIERGIMSTSLEGEHLAAKLANGVLRWQMTYSRSTRDEPDLRETIRGRNDDGSFSFLPLPQSSFRFFNGLSDRILEPQVDWSKPFYFGGISGLVKTGFRGTFRRRDFAARRFRFVPVRSSTLNFSLPANLLLGPDNIRPDGFELRENTRGTDTYAASMDTYAGFAMVDLSLSRRWRLSGGVRIEDADIMVRTIDPLVPGSIPSTANLTNRDALPGVNLIYSLSGRQNLRFGYGRTLSRPDFRELSPFDFTNVLGGFNVVGNPNLKRAQIDNLDARWEWFTGADSLIAASFFFKDFTDPIEVNIQPTTDLRQTFINAAGARNQGVELEFRNNLGRLHPSLRSLTLHANATLVDSNVRIPPEQAPILTTKSRPLVGQSRYIYNVITEWVKPRWRSNARFYLNSVSRRISDVGSFGLPDIYQERNNFMDFVYQFDVLESGKMSIRFAAENLGDNHYRWTQAGILQRSFRTGRTFTVGTSFSIY
jgi:outer membrane receptor protein involved in Fe transport